MPDRRRSALRAWVPVVLSLLVQLATTAWGLQLNQPELRDAHSPFAAHGAIAPLRDGLGPALPPPAWLVAVAFLIAVIGPALLVLVRRRPGPAVALIAATAVFGTVLFEARGLGAPFYVSVLFGIAGAAFLRARAWAWACAGAYWLTFALASLLSGNVFQLGWLVPLTLLSVGALLGPEFGRGRQEARARAVREAETRAAQEAQAERVRIARELHDVLAHSLSQINVQASVGLHLFDSQPAKAEDALASIKDASKQALGEVRQVLGMLRGDDAPLAPEHGLADLEELVAGVRGQGTDAVLRVEVTDASRLPTAVQQAAYRIVQEALTNVTRHAHATRVDVIVEEVGSLMRLRIADDGSGAKSSPLGAGWAGANPQQVATTSAAAGGRGLLGMRERAELLGGSFHAGPRADGGFEVTAELPLAAAP